MIPIDDNAKEDNRLGIVFDIDGTLILEADDNEDVVLRQGSMEFLRWCKQRGHSIALWTAASEEHLQSCLQVFCPLITPDQHQCSPHCNQTFDFAWSHSKLKQQSLISSMNFHRHLQDDVEGCRWCRPYCNTCRRCRCITYVCSCPCMYVKDLKKVWKSSSSETRNFCLKERILIIEDTPQKCIDNYGNAIYVPTFDGNPQNKDLEQVLFQRLKRLILELEKVSDVRTYPKCQQIHSEHYCCVNGHVSSKPHACFHQDWLYHDTNQFKELHKGNESKKEGDNAQTLLSWGYLQKYCQTQIQYFLSIELIALRLFESPNNSTWAWNSIGTDNVAVENEPKEKYRDICRQPNLRDEPALNFLYQRYLSFWGSEYLFLQLTSIHIATSRNWKK